MLPIGTSGYNPVTDVTIVQAATTNFDHAEHWRGEYEAQESIPAFTALL